MEHLDELVAVHAPLLTKNLTDFDSLLVEAYLRQLRQNRAAVTVLLEERLKQCFQGHQTKHSARCQNELTDVLAVSRVSDMFLAECEAEILSLYLSGDLIRAHRDVTATNEDRLLVTNVGEIARKVAQKVLEWTLEKLLPLLQALSDSAAAPDAVKQLIALLKGVLLLEVMRDCADSVPAGPSSVALKVAIVALQKLLNSFDAHCLTTSTALLRSGKHLTRAMGILLDAVHIT